MAQKQARGSEKLLEERLGKPQPISEAALRQLVDISRKYDVKIFDWRQFGQPAIDGIAGTFQVKPELAGKLLEDIFALDNDLRLHWEVFPYGVPVLEELLVNFRTPGMR